jgi:hypothetical protein
MSSRAAMSRLRTEVGELPVVLAGMLIGSVVLGVAGCVVGLVIGLRVHPATAWFAMIEVGVPCAVLGSLLGLVAGVLARRRGRWSDGSRTAAP